MLDALAALEPGHDRHRRPALLRLRDRRRAARDGRRRLARLAPGTARTSAASSRPRAPRSRTSPRAGCWRCSACPRDARVGFVTGATMANLVGLAAARHRVLATAGWDVEEHGLAGAPPVRVLVGDEVHVSLLKALRLLGFGSAGVERIPVDANGAMQPGPLAAALRDGRRARRSSARRPATSTRARCDPLLPIVAAAREAGAWVHVDGAFGLWAAASPRLAVAGGGRRRRRLVGARRAQVAQRALRLRRGDRRRRRGARGRDVAPPPTTCWRATTGSPRRPRCRAAAARSRSTPRCATSAAAGSPSSSSAAATHARAARRRDGAARGRRGAQRRRAQPGPAALRRRRRAHRARDRGGPARRRGVAGRHRLARHDGARASRSRTGRRPTTDVDRLAAALRTRSRPRAAARPFASVAAL